MIRAIVRKELKEVLRDGRIIALVLLIVGLGAAAALHGRNQVRSMEREVRAARLADRDTWHNQGEKNPHSAAHFSRYAFRSVSTLSIFDPGLTEYVGSAVWLEAHYRDPAKFRPIDDAVEIQRFATLSPAWILQCLVPLLIVLLAFSSIAGEREQGTLRHVMSTGVAPTTIFWGKSWAVLLAISMFVPVVIAAVFLAGADQPERTPDLLLRYALLVGAYTVYLVGFTFAVIGVSACLQRAKPALVMLLGFWALATVLAPRLSADVAEILHPAPEGTEFWAELRKESSTAFWSKEAKPYRDKIRDDLLKKHGVESVEELPINFDGYLLQASEEFANDVFDRRYGELSDLFGQQHFIARLFGVISPTIAVRSISRAFSGTDLYAHQHFTNSAELFRRDLIKTLNQDMIDKAGSAGYGYLADETLWKRTPDFEYQSPAIGQIWAQTWPDAVVLLAWGILGFLLAFRGVRLSFAEEAST